MRVPLPVLIPQILVKVSPLLMMELMLSIRMGADYAERPSRIHLDYFGAQSGFQENPNFSIVNFCS